MTSQIDILLPTYNGSMYLADQLHSLFNQTKQNFRLIIRDDESTDDTKQIIAEWRDRYPTRIACVAATQNVGVVKSISTLLGHSTAPYVMLCDQDDVWLPTKIADTLDHMRKLESYHSQAHPILVHSDLQVVDESLSPISPSYWEHTRIDPYRGGTLNRLLVQNCVTGCTAMLNRALVDQVGALPDCCVMHDGWIALVASCLGTIGIHPKATILYRQHGKNDTGAFAYSLKNAIGSLVNKRSRERLGNHRRLKYEQAKTLLDRYHKLLTHKQQTTITEYVLLDGYSQLRRIRHMYKNDFVRSGFLRNCQEIVY